MPNRATKLQVWIALVVALVLWILLDATELGRFMYAIGGNEEAARLSGIRTRLLRTVGFMIVATTAAMVGILISAAGAGYTPNAGQYLLLPAYAGAFLGAACFRPGEFNIPGTVVGVLFLGTIVILLGPENKGVTFRKVPASDLQLAPGD